MHAKLRIVIIVVAAAVVISFAIYTISPIFISNTANEPLPTTAVVVNPKMASQAYQKFISMSDQDRINAAKQMTVNDKNLVMVGAARVIIL
jgi:hypothetical protein